MKYMFQITILQLVFFEDSWSGKEEHEESHHYLG